MKTKVSKLKLYYKSSHAVYNKSTIIRVDGMDVIRHILVRGARGIKNSMMKGEVAELAVNDKIFRILINDINTKAPIGFRIREDGWPSLNNAEKNGILIYDDIRCINPLMRIVSTSELEKLELG